MFEQVRIKPDDGDAVQISAPGADRSKLQYVAGVRVGTNDAAGRWTKSWIGHDDLLSAGRIWFSLSDSPTSWGTRTADQPPSHGDGSAVGARPFVAVDGPSPTMLMPGQSVEARVGIANLSSTEVTASYAAGPAAPLAVSPASGSVTAAAGQRAGTAVTVSVPEGTPSGVYSVPVTFTDTGSGEELGTVAIAVKVPTLPHSGRWMYYSGKRDNMSATLTRTVQVPATGATSMNAWLLYATESGFDYIYGEVSTDGGATWQQVGDRLDGSSDGWRELSWSLDAYAGQEVQFRLRYTTDGGVLEQGVYADDFSLVNGGQTVWSDDVESDDAGWTIAEFTKVDHALLDD
jgi:hypothetical protein